MQGHGFIVLQCEVRGHDTFRCHGMGGIIMVNDGHFFLADRINDLPFVDRYCLGALMFQVLVNPGYGMAFFPINAVFIRRADKIRPHGGLNHNAYFLADMMFIRPEFVVPAVQFDIHKIDGPGYNFRIIFSLQSLSPLIQDGLFVAIGNFHEPMIAVR